MLLVAWEFDSRDYKSLMQATILANSGKLWDSNDLVPSKEIPPKIIDGGVANGVAVVADAAGHLRGRCRRR